MLPPNFDTSFWEKVHITTADACWEWAGVRTRGYGQVSVLGKMAYAHRIAYELFFGEFDRRLHVLHKCDNPSCCNPSHLFLGTHQDNMRDRDAKGRQRTPTGDAHYRRQRPGSGPCGGKHGQAVLSSEQVEALRARYKNGLPRGAVTAEAKALGVSKTTISRILKGKIWKQRD